MVLTYMWEKHPHMPNLNYACICAQLYPTNTKNSSSMIAEKYACGASPPSKESD